ncbi:hypothetical protein [Vibrio methylphosphonaticus]|uniref:hypothetical protein n=1 Tax=Vibrio methylphosphonaticus TaxID=2946866 RepID=UPI002029EBCA|nr:hypothetical protein [Vibrio methylphosphonaticus]MCL9776009.1 hypothetical protein [Vibrio methylphosphonaticus]
MNSNTQTHTHLYVNKQMGMVTLLTTSLLLIVALVIALGGYKNTFYEVKRSQNEIASRQAHWAAEGGVECGIAQYMITRTIPASILACDLEANIVPEIIVDSTNSEVVISATVQRREVSRRFTHSFQAFSGAIQSTSDLYIYGSTSIYTPDPGQLSDNGWECIAAKYDGELKVVGSIDNKGLNHGLPPYDGFDNQRKNCATSHMTSDSNSSLKNDFQFENDLKVFESFFNIPIKNHDQVKSSEAFTVLEGIVSGSSMIKAVPNCGKVLTEQLEKGNSKLWVEGSCEIGSTELHALSQASAKTKGILLVVHEGLFSVMGTGSINGVLFHFNQDFSPELAMWEGFEAGVYLHHESNDFELPYRERTSYYQHGSFTVTGGQFFETPDPQVAIFNNSLAFNYNRDVIDHARQGVTSTTWKKGSWRDF